jgi:hypothetical protein
VSQEPKRFDPSQWWGTAVPRANRIYALVSAVAALVVFLLPHVLGTTITCAEYMETDWMLVVLLTAASIGVLNVIFSFVSQLEALLPAGLISPLRTTLIVFVPVVAQVGILWFTVGAFVPILMNDPELLCD